MTDRIGNGTERSAATKSLLTRRSFLRLSVGGVTVATVVFPASGCGGGKGSTGESNNRNRLEVVLDWPERQPAGQSRYIPPYALSVVLELYPKANPSDPNEKHTQTVNRPDGDAAITQRVYFDQDLKIGSYVLVGEARTQKDGGGTTIASAQTECEVRPDTIARPGLTLASSIAQVEILGQPITVLVGEQITLSGRAVDTNGQVILLPDGTLTWQQVSGSECASITAVGVVTGVASGMARVRLVEPQALYSSEADITVRSYTDGLAQSPWPKFRGNALNTGRRRSSRNGGGTTGVKKWEFFAVGGGGTSPAIGADGTVYIGMGGKVRALHEETGVLKWEYGPDNNIYPMSTTPAISADGTVYIGTQGGVLHALDGATGAKKWGFMPGEGIHSSPAIGMDGMIYFGCFDRVYALDSTGRIEKWEFPIGEGVFRRFYETTWSSPAIGEDGTVYIGSDDYKVYALDGTTGAKKWEFLTGGYVQSSPAISEDGTVYIGSNDGKLYALDGAIGTKKWEFLAGNIVRSSPAIGEDGTVYIAGTNSSTLMYALDGATGAPKWEFSSPHSTMSSPAIGPDGTLYFGCYDNKVYAVDITTGIPKWEFLTGSSVTASPAIGADGTVYIASWDGKVYAIG
jgi:outer membrane protein assembly factor BamB